MRSIVRVRMIGLLGLVLTTGAPLAAQTNLKATATAPTTVALTWTAGTNATGYWVQRAVGKGQFANITPAKLPGTAYTDASAPAGSALKYRIRGTYSGGPAVYSNKVSVTTPAATSTASAPPAATTTASAPPATTAPATAALVPMAIAPVTATLASPSPGQPTVAPAVKTTAAAGALQPIAVQPSPERLSRTPMTAGPAPENLRVESQGPLAHTVLWDALPEASGYLVAFTGKTGGQFLTLTPQPIAQPSFDLLAQVAPPAGIGTYRETPREIFVPSFQHAAFVTSGGTYRVTALYPDGRQGSADFVYANPPEGKAPTGFSVKKTGTGQVALTWKPVDFAKTYRIFGTGQPGDGLVVSTVGTTFSNLPYGSYSWQVTADYGGLYQTAGLPTVHITLSPPIVGFADTHTHPFANLASGGKVFFGRAFGPIGAELAFCNSSHGQDGLGDVIGNIYRTKSGNLSFGHNTSGFPNFGGWPTWRTLTHQQMHSDWIYRAYQGGLRLMVAHAVNNALLCEVAPKDPPRTCDDMEAVDLQIQAAKDMEAYIDSQSGGAGKGWFRIAYTPEQARQIISDGKLAVVLGIEVDKLFGCGKGECDANTVNTRLDKYYGKGVRHLYPVHLADNAFGGFALTGEDLFKLNSTLTNPGGAFGPGVVDENCSSRGFDKTCNSRRLTPLGDHLIRSMMNKGMIIDIDHMGMHTTDTVLALTAARKYPVVSGHTGFVGTATAGHSSEREKSDGWLAAINLHGGMVSVGLTAGEARSYPPSWRGPIANDCPKTSRTFAQSYLYAVDKMGGPDIAAVGLATDQFLTEWAGPRFDGHCPGESPATKVAYPFTTRTGVSLAKSHPGTRDFDYNTDGLAHFGLLPDLIQDLKNLGLTNRDLDPLFRSAEGYIRMWERAVSSIPVP